VCVCHHFNVQLTSPPVLKLLDSQGYLWLCYDLAEVIKLIGETFEQKVFFSKKYFVIPSTLLSFLPYYCCSFCIIVIPSALVSFPPNYCHSFRVIVIPSELLLLIILNSSCTLPYPKGGKIGWQSRPYLRVSYKEHFKRLKCDSSIEFLTFPTCPTCLAFRRCTGVLCIILFRQNKTYFMI
jgi:hypothetical protein